MNGIVYDAQKQTLSVTTAANQEWTLVWDKHQQIWTSHPGEDCPPHGICALSLVSAFTKLLNVVDSEVLV